MAYCYQVVLTVVLFVHVNMMDKEPEIASVMPALAALMPVAFLDSGPQGTCELKVIIGGTLFISRTPINPSTIS